MCEVCMTYHKQNEILDKAIAKLLEERKKEKLKLTDDQKESIKKVAIQP